jgi:hypothetical protein
MIKPKIYYPRPSRVRKASDCSCEAVDTPRSKYKLENDDDLQKLPNEKPRRRPMVLALRRSSDHRRDTHKRGHLPSMQKKGPESVSLRRVRGCDR